jgi:hypothetical protein
MKDLCPNCDSHLTVDVSWHMCYECQSTWTNGTIEETFWREKIAKEIEILCRCPEEAFLEQGFHSCYFTRCAERIRTKKGAV